jgi:hypothetical protein
LTHIYTRGEEVVRDTLKIYADTTVAARKAVVSDVLNLAKDRFPAKSYGMLLSSHGTGWAPQGYCYSPPDKTSGGIFGLDSYLYDGPAKYHEKDPLLKSIGSHYNGSPSRSIEIATSDLAAAIPMHMDYILFDACFMGCVEVAYELKDKCDMMCFSQAEILSNGMDWSTDGKLFYHTDSDTGILKEYDFDITTGSISYTGRSVKVPHLDGMTFSDSGLIYVACWGTGHVAVVDSSVMEIVKYIDVPVPIPTSCGFFGKSMDMLAVTTANYNDTAKANPESGYTFFIKTDTHGKPPYLFG